MLNIFYPLNVLKFSIMGFILSLMGCHGADSFTSDFPRHSHFKEKYNGIQIWSFKSFLQSLWSSSLGSQ